ncbi:MAG: phosphoribosylaminoimidazolesuccinocarboxamide synthase [Acidobacteria bacterium]|nr:MAG: phosphoribosylaminoimidazolesuccinocarboxamide synthase [Acidobacteriota bacterium]
MDHSAIQSEVLLPNFELLGRGKVRDIYSVKDHLLIIATDRISAFDFILGNGIPGKGKVLTQMSLFWFEFTDDIVSNHLVTAEVEELPVELREYMELLRGRSMLVKKAQPFPVECVVRGYLAGSGWKEYQSCQSVCGIRLPPGLEESSKLREPIFTPATKSSSGHDENIPFEKVVDLVGRERAERLKECTLAIYRRAADYALTKGIIIADTKLEFGIYQDQIILIDEVLTPDSSRFWPVADYLAGRAQKSFDKQFVRDYLEQIGWNKQPPAPSLPEWVVEATGRKYQEAFQRLTGRKLQA